MKPEIKERIREAKTERVENQVGKKEKGRPKLKGNKISGEQGREGGKGINNRGERGKNGRKKGGKGRDDSKGE